MAEFFKYFTNYQPDWHEPYCYAGIIILAIIFLYNYFRNNREVDRKLKEKSTVQDWTKVDFK